MVESKQQLPDTEARIIDAARELFIEKGYAATSMSDIAARAGMNRPALHYYFRTKERMFRAVFGGIVDEIVPRIQGIILRHELLPEDRVAMVVDVYYGVLKANPSLPIFLMREMHRDFANVAETMRELRIIQYFDSIKSGLVAEMNSGILKCVPLRYVFMTFYSMVIMPFGAKDLCCALLLDEGETFDDLLGKWKCHIVATIVGMLKPGLK